MAKGRMIASALPGSKKLARCPERAAMVYVFGMGATDREGRFEADDDSLLDCFSRYARARGWTDESVAADRAHLGEVGLWIVYGEPGNELVQVVDFHRHNRSDPRESPSSIPPPPGYDDARERKRWGRPIPADLAQQPPGDPRTTTGDTPERPRNDPGPPPAEGKGKGKGKAEVEGKGKGQEPRSRPAAPPAPAVHRTEKKPAPPAPLRDECDSLLSTLLERTSAAVEALPRNGDPDAWIHDARAAAEAEHVPIDPDDPEAEHDLRLAIAAFVGMAPQDPLIAVTAAGWATDRFTLNAAVQVIRRTSERGDIETLRSPLAYLRTAVPARAKELQDRIRTAVENALDGHDAERHRRALGVERPYDPTA